VDVVVRRAVINQRCRRQPDQQRAVEPEHPDFGDVAYGELELDVAAHDHRLAELPDFECGVAGEDEAARPVERIDGELEPRGRTAPGGEEGVLGREIPDLEA